MSAKWIWYPGDFEIYHGMLQNFAREERGMGWPAYWKMDDWRKNMKFSKEYDLLEDMTFCVHGYGVGYVAIDEAKHQLEKELKLEAGHHKIEVFIGNMTALPCIYIDDGIIQTDESWIADDFTEGHHAGTSSLFTKKEQNPNEVPYTEEKVDPAEITEREDGLLFDFARMLNHADLKVTLNGLDEVTVVYGESIAEATDLKWCYYKQEHVTKDTLTRQRAFRYVFLPGAKKGQANISATHRQVMIPIKASFKSNDARLDKIWEVSKETYRLCSEMFFIDGIKRDRWIWAGDAYQSFFVNPYLFFDKEINQRTTRAVRGNTPFNQHLNTIVDYSMLWMISLWNEYELYGDEKFLEEMLPKAEAMMELFISQTDSEGFIYGRERDWIYIDWTDMDKDGTISGEQILLWKCYLVMRNIYERLGLDSSFYEQKAGELKNAINKFFWDEEKNAYIDCYASGKRNVTRHANIFAILFDFVDDKRRDEILESVLFNDAIPAITTPYFKFYELDVLGKTGHLDEVMETIKSYWGGMIDEGATTFWEQYDPTKSGDEHYEMYGDPFGKSLCHAWAASPIYLLGRYFLGVKPTSVGYKTFEVKPELSYFDELHCKVPVADGSVVIDYKDGKLEVKSDCEGGVLIHAGKEETI